MTLRYPDRDGEVSAVKFSPEHRWKYIRGLTPEEGVLIKWWVSFSLVSHHLRALFCIVLVSREALTISPTTVVFLSLLLTFEPLCLIALIRNRTAVSRFSHHTLPSRTRRRRRMRR